MKRYVVEVSLIPGDLGECTLIQWGPGSERYTIATFKGPEGRVAAETISDLLNANALDDSRPEKWNRPRKF